MAIMTDRKAIRVAFQGEPGAFSEAAAMQLLGESITTVPRATFEAIFRSIAEEAADAILAPMENSLAGSVVRVFDLLLESQLTIVAETILPIEMQLIALPGTSLNDICSVASHPMALAQCERFFALHPKWKRVPAEDTAGSVREMISCGDKSRAAIAGSRAAEHYHGLVLAERIQDNPENFTRFVLLVPNKEAAGWQSAEARKTSLAVRLAHRPGRQPRPGPRRSAQSDQRTPRPRALRRRFALKRNKGNPHRKIRRPAHGRPSCLITLVSFAWLLAVAALRIAHAAAGYVIAHSPQAAPKPLRKLMTRTPQPRF